MILEVTGKVVEVESRSFVTASGETRQTFDAYIASDNPRYGADRISGPADLTPKEGTEVRYRANVRARAGARGPWLSIWCVEALPVSASKRTTAA